MYFRSNLSDYFVLSYHCFINEKITLNLLKVQCDFMVNISTPSAKYPTYSLGFIFFVCLCDYLFSLRRCNTRRQQLKMLKRNFDVIFLEDFLLKVVLCNIVVTVIAYCERLEDLVY